MSDREINPPYDADEHSDKSVEDHTQTAVQRALNNAREHRDRNLTRDEKSSKSSKKPKSRPQYFYNPEVEADNRSVATTAVSMAGEYVGADGRAMQVVAIPAGAKLKTVGDGESDDDDDMEEFEDLTYDEIQINLRLLGDLVQDEKIHISSDRKTMVVDNRYDMMGVRRAWSGDSRGKSLRFVKHVFGQTEDLCNDIVDRVNRNDQPKENTEKLINLYGLITASAKGLDRLNMTYASDKLCAARIATIKKGYETYCDQTLKKTIDGFKQNYV
jgi:hypothetical protein